MHKKMNDGYEPATGSMDQIPPLDDTSNHTDLHGIYRDVRFIDINSQGEFLACAEDKSVLFQMTATGALKLIAVSNLIATRTRANVLAAMERSAS